MEGAYRTIPVKPDHKRYLIIHFDGGFYINHNVLFSLTSASGLQSEVANATIDIWEYHEISPASGLTTSTSFIFLSLMVHSLASVMVSTTHMVIISHLSNLWLLHWASLGTRTRVKNLLTLSLTLVFSGISTTRPSLSLITNGTSILQGVLPHLCVRVCTGLQTPDWECHWHSFTHYLHSPSGTFIYV